jgi:formylglycine-generating enzyme required for sulfatase activity
MLANVGEWCQNGARESRKGKKGLYIDNANTLLVINENNPRLLRGGSFSVRPALVRSAFRDWYAPAYRYSGFRPARTCN